MARMGNISSLNSKSFAKNSIYHPSCVKVKLSVSDSGEEIFTELQEGSLLRGRGSEQEQRDPHDHLLRREILPRKRDE